jgi:hypothetical protein
MSIPKKLTALVMSMMLIVMVGTAVAQQAPEKKFPEDAKKATPVKKANPAKRPPAPKPTPPAKPAPKTASAPPSSSMRITKGISVIMLPGATADSSSIARQHSEKPFPEDPKRGDGGKP